MARDDLQRPEGAAGDWTIPQDWEAYTPAQHAMWDALFDRQAKMLPGRVVPEFLEGLNILRMSKPGIPDFRELSQRLFQATGWQVLAVPGLVPDRVFFEYLAHRRFVAGRSIRRPDQMDYLQEPDVFHDVFGHVPLLANPVFAEYMQAYGAGGLRADGMGAIHRLARLYWYTVEFGLIRKGDGLGIYGAGIVSSYAESFYSLESPSPNRLGFDLERLMRTNYCIDRYQRTYFVIDSFESLLKTTLETDFAPLYRKLEKQSDLDPGAVLPQDKVFNVSGQARTFGRVSA